MRRLLLDVRSEGNLVSVCGWTRSDA